MELIPARLLKNTRAIQFLPVWASAPGKEHSCIGEMVESGVIKDTAMVYGQMNEPPGVRSARGALRAFDGGIFPRSGTGCLCLFIDNILPLLDVGSEVSAVAWPDAFRSWLPANPGDRDGASCKSALHPLGPARYLECRLSTCQPMTIPTLPPVATFTHLDATIVGASIVDKGIYPAVRPAGIHLAHLAPRETISLSSACAITAYLRHHQDGAMMLSEVYKSAALVVSRPRRPGCREVDASGSTAG